MSYAAFRLRNALPFLNRPRRAGEHVRSRLPKPCRVWLHPLRVLRAFRRGTRPTPVPVAGRGRKDVVYRKLPVDPSTLKQ